MPDKETIENLVRLYERASTALRAIKVLADMSPVSGSDVRDLADVGLDQTLVEITGEWEQKALQPSPGA